MSKMKMQPLGLDYDEILAEGDPQKIEAIKFLGNEVKYNQYLYNFLDNAYDWQKKTIEFTKDHTVVGTIAANRVGKSEVGCAIVACHLCGIYPSWWQGRIYNRPVKVMVACKNLDLNKTVLQEKLFGTSNWRMKEEIGTGMIPREFINIKSAVSPRGDGITTINIKHVTGGWSELYFRAYEQGAEAAQGVSADLVLIDEQPKDSFWSEAMTRIADRGGHAVCTFTPLQGLTGLVETMMSLSEVKDAPYDKFGVKYKSEDDWAMVRASWDDITHIEEKTKKTLQRGYLAYEADARMYGLPIAGHGRIFPHNQSDYVYDPNEKQVLDSWPHLIGIDVGHGHGRDPSAAVLVAWDEVNDVIYVREARREPTDTTRDLARLIVKVDHRAPVAWPNDAGRTSLNSPTSAVEQLGSMDIKMLGKAFMNPMGADNKRNNYKMPGIVEINQRFAEGKLKISHLCDPLIHEIEQYSYTENGKLQDGKDDTIDAFRYAVMSLIQGFGDPLTEEAWQTAEDDDYTFQPY